MENLIQEIDNTVSYSFNQINDKLYGINFLEHLKYIFLDNINNIQNFDNKIPFKKELNKNYKDKKLLIKIEFNQESSTNIKKVLREDQLSIVLSGFKDVEIHSDNSLLESKNSNFIKIFAKTGLVLCKNTVINESIAKNTILVDIIIIKDELDIEKK